MKIRKRILITDVIKVYKKLAKFGITKSNTIQKLFLFTNRITFFLKLNHQDTDHFKVHNIKQELFGDYA